MSPWLNPHVPRGPAKPLQLRHPWENTMQQPPPSPHRESVSSCPVKKGKIHAWNLGFINKNASYYICSVYIYIYHYNIYIYCEGPVQRNHVCWNSKLHFQSGLARTHPPGPKGRGRGAGCLLVVPAMHFGHRFSFETLIQSHAKPVPAEAYHF